VGLLNEGTRFMIDTLKERINQVVFGFDGTMETPEDGGVGRPAVILTPTVTVIDDNTLLVEAILPLTTTFSKPLREVVIRYQNPTDATDTTDLFRYTYQSITKTVNNEIRLSVTVEVTA